MVSSPSINPFETARSLLIAVFAFLPGIAGDRVYRSLLGADWRESHTSYILRLLMFSVCGVLVYLLLAVPLGLPRPVYLFPSTFIDGTLGPNNIEGIAWPYAGHFIGSGLTGLTMTGLARFLSKYSGHSPYPAAWDDFVRTHVADRWVVASLKSGEVYAGKLKTADIAVARGDRDIVLEEPALWDGGTRYISTSYQYIYLPSELISAVAAVARSKDDRSVPIGESLFPDGVR